jgi:quinol-cytochrome oxidoreductase complex cytochrome b subunit
MYVGSMPATEQFVLAGRIFTLFYFSYFFVVLPVLAFIDS